MPGHACRAYACHLLESRAHACPLGVCMPFVKEPCLCMPSALTTPVLVHAISIDNTCAGTSEMHSVIDSYRVKPWIALMEEEKKGNLIVVGSHAGVELGNGFRGGGEGLLHLRRGPG